jgi:class 3 adenylate cyclase
MTNLNIGVRGRLLLAFFGISAFAVLGAVVALFAFAEIGRVFDRVTSERVPASFAALELSRQTERIASAGPLILAGTNIVEQMRTDSQIRKELAALAKLFAEVKRDRSDSISLSEIESSIAEIRQNVAQLQQSIAAHTCYGGPISCDLPALVAQSQPLLRRNREASARLAAAVDRLVQDERVEIAKAEATVAATQRTSTGVMLGVVALSLICSALIVWLYVGRRIVGRLTALSKSMLAIAGGDLKAPLPDNTGRDEIGSMADALRIFRDKVVENERLGRLKGFLAPQVAELIVTSGDESVLDSHRRDVAVLFCDLRGFTAFAETSEPEEIMEFLREYHESLGHLVDKYAGTLERFTGDGLIVLFNDPLPSPDPCLAAARLAVEMRAGVNEIVRRRRQLRNRLGFGIGIAYGYATLGRVGFKGRFDYTAIGSVVNLAARLCERAQANQILVDSNVHAAVEGRLETETLGEFQPKGFSKPVVVFNIVAQQISCH